MRKSTPLPRNYWLADSQYDTIKSSAHAAAKDVLAENVSAVENIEAKLHLDSPAMLMIVHSVIDRAIGEVTKYDPSVARAKLNGMGLKASLQSESGQDTEYSKFMASALDDSEKQLFDRAVKAGLATAEVQLKEAISQPLTRSGIALA